MRARRVLWLAGALISLLPLAALRAPVAADSPMNANPAATRFPHQHHVPTEWLSRGETPRDCRGCHQYDADPAVEAGLPQPEGVCAKCHYPIAGQPSIQVQGTLAATRAKEGTSPTFAHGDHLKMDCKSCHVDPNYRGSKVPEDMWVPSGMGWCLKCHDETSKGTPTGRGFEKWIDLANAGDAGGRFAAGLNAHPGMRKSGKAAFRHEDHLEAKDLRDAGRCAECHQSMSSADAAIGEAVFATTDCGKCHRDADARALEVGTEQRSFTSSSDLTFFHSDHLSASALAIGQIKSDGCFACHELGPMVDRDGLLSYPVKDVLRTYDGCVKCHDADGVKGATGTTRWGVADHGDVGHHSGDQRTCNKCHVIGDLAAPMKTSRPGREVDRRRPTLFDITEQVHPHMTGSADVKNRACAECHLAEIDRIPSRIRGVPFDHDSHLGKDPTPADCVKCHSPQPAKLGGMMQADAPGLGVLTYDELSCRECHRGIERSDQRLRAAEYREVGHPVAIFDHNDHLEKGGAVLHACGDCHVAVPAADRGTSGRHFTEPEDVLTCVKCHDHGEGFETCDGADQAYVNTCVDCHEAHTKGLPEPDRAYPIERAHVASLTGTQFHPAPKDTRCAECHRTRPEGLAARVGVVTCDLNYSNSEIHNKPGSSFPPACFACHWGDPQNVSAGRVSQLLIGGQLVPNTQLKGRLTTTRIREVLGGELRNFPGGPGR